MIRSAVRLTHFSRTKCDVLRVVRCTSSVTNLHLPSALTNVRVHKNISLHTCSSTDHTKRPITVLMPWLGARDNHIQKYRSFWLNKGFDVLTVKVFPKDVLLPKFGSIPLMQNLIECLYLLSPKYEDILMHCFSTAAYEFGEMMYNLNDKQFMNKICKVTSSDVKETIEKSIKGLIFDSAVGYESFSVGVSNTFTSNPIVQKPLELYFSLYLKLAYPILTKFFLRAIKQTHKNYLKVPTLMISSHLDTISPPFISSRYAKEWRDRGIDVTERIFNDSKHVQHMIKYEREYVQEVDTLLDKVSFSSLPGQQ